MKKTVTLPPPSELERICKGLAALDAIVCEDWEGRCYSFDSKWAAKLRVASMRNGSGDDWFIVFAPGSVFVKSFWHEYPHEDVAALYAGLPAALAPQLHEPAFSMENVTFGGWHQGEAWTLRGNANPMADELVMLGGKAADYCRYAADYFEVELESDDVAQVLAGKQLDAKLLERLSSERTLAQLKDDLAEIGYGT